jgi:K+-sensing histidine kinase KdpD
MLWDFKRFGETPKRHKKRYASRTVDERMKSERMKTELITNVSHDKKTPLTSIINYVDLIKKEEVKMTLWRLYRGAMTGNRQS